jgi:glycerol-3-phosphate dehydrogenase
MEYDKMRLIRGMLMENLVSNLIIYRNSNVGEILEDLTAIFAKYHSGDYDANELRGEILDVIHRNVGATTVKGVKKRCRPGAGRCQGGFCSPRVVEILARELGCEMDEVMYDAKDKAYILNGKTKSQN